MSENIIEVLKGYSRGISAILKKNHPNLNNKFEKYGESQLICSIDEDNYIKVFPDDNRIKYEIGKIGLDNNRKYIPLKVVLQQPSVKKYLDDKYKK